MNAEQACEVLGWLTGAGVAVWVDGGWGVDALLAEQTRTHDDLDVVVAVDGTARLIAVLRQQGFDVVTDEQPTRIVLRRADGVAIDVHLVTLTSDGGGTQRLPGDSVFSYPAKSFGASSGRIGECLVPCISVEAQLAAHRGYPPSAKDRRDMERLARRFGFELPAELLD